MRALKMRSIVASHQELTKTHWEQSLTLILLQLCKKLLKNSTSTILLPFGVWRKLERWKNSTSGCLMSWPKKNCRFEVSSLILHNNNSFSFGLLCATRSGFYMTTNNSQLSGWTEKKLQSTSQSQTCTKKRSWSLVACCPSDPLQLSESQWNHYILEVCSTNRWEALKTVTPAVVIGQQNWPNSPPWQQLTALAQPNLQKLNQLGFEVLPHPPYSPALSPTDHHLFKHLDNF